MKTESSLLFLTFCSLVFIADAAAQEPISFKGRVTQSRYRELVGRECSAVLSHEAQEPNSGLIEERYFVTLKIEGVRGKKNPKAPKKDMFLYTNEGDVFHGQGSKWRGEVSQQIFVTMDPTHQRVVKWQYIDGTSEILGGFTHTCE